MEHKYCETYGALTDACFAIEDGKVVQKTYADFIDAIRIRYWEGRQDFHWHVLAVPMWYSGFGDTPKIDAVDGVPVEDAWRHRLYLDQADAEENAKAAQADGMPYTANQVGLYSATRYTLTNGRKMYALFLTTEAAARHLAKTWKEEILIWGKDVFATQEEAQAALCKAKK